MCRTGTAIEDVRGAIAGDDVVQGVAGAVDRARPSQRQVLDVAYGVNGISKAEADRRLNQVRAVAAGLVDHVARIVDHIGVVARATEHRVRTGTAIQPGCCAALLPVRMLLRALPVPLIALDPSQRQVLDVAYGVDSIGEAEADRGLNQVVPSPPVSLTTSPALSTT